MDVHRYPHDLGRRERALCCDRSRDGIDSTLEDDEERIALRIDS